MTSTFTIEFPTPGEESTPANLLARALGIHPWAVALVTLGWPAAPRVHHTEQSTGEAYHPTWYLGSYPGKKERSLKAAARLIHQATKAQGLEALSTADPGHPFFACMAAITNLSRVVEWQTKGGSLATAPMPGSLFFTVQPEAIGASNGFSHGTFSIHIAAALLATGLLPFPSPVFYQGCSCVGFASDPVVPGLLESCLSAGEEIVGLQIAGKPWQSFAATIVLGNAAPGEHPFLFALAAALNVPGMLAKQSEAQGDPIRILQNPFRPSYRVLVTESLKEGNRAVREQIHKHLNDRS